MTCKTRKTTKTAKTLPTYTVTAWRETNQVDWFGDLILEANVVGYGWCKYGRRFSTLLIDGKIVSDSNWRD